MQSLSLSRHAIGCVGLSLAILIGCSQKPESLTKAEPAKLTTGKAVLDAMVEAYREAKTYSDAGVVRFRAKLNGDDIDQSDQCSVAFERPNKISIQANDAVFVSDGQQMRAISNALPKQVLSEKAPEQLTIRTIFADPELARALSKGTAGPPPQLALLLEKDPLQALMQGGDEVDLVEPGTIDGREYYRVELKRPDGVLTLWIDKESFVLRRIGFPTDELAKALAATVKLESASLVADFVGAQLNGPIDPMAFKFETPPGAKLVKYLLPPSPVELLGKTLPDFKFVDLDGKPVTPKSLAGKVTVIDIWATWCQPCLQNFPAFEKTYQKYKDRVTFLAVSVDESNVDSKTIRKKLAELKVNIPTVRDPERYAAKGFYISGIPTTLLISADGVVQDVESGANPKLESALSEKLDSLLAGKNLYEESLKKHNEQLERYRKSVETARKPPADSSDVQTQEIPKTEIAKRTEPKNLKFKQLWKCDKLKMPGNILIVRKSDGTPRILVIDAWKTVVEIANDGKSVKTHTLDMPEDDLVTMLRTSVDKNSKRYFAAFASAQQRVHLFDENFKLLTSYPDGTDKNPHAGISDVELGDLDGDGKLNMYVGYWGVVGVQGVSLEGKRLWYNRSISTIMRMAIGTSDAKAKPRLVVANNTGVLTVLGAEGKQQDKIAIPNQMVHWIVSADLTNDGQAQWCGLSTNQSGESFVVGIGMNGKLRWSQKLTSGIHQQPIEPLVSGNLSVDEPGQWLVPGSDGSILIISVDGKLIDKFNYGDSLSGLGATVVNGQPILLIATKEGVEALGVEWPKGTK